MSSDLMIRASGVGKSYQFYTHYGDRFKQMVFGRFKKFYRDYWVLRDITFEAQRGESIGIIGRNGAGKSTLLQIICGITAPTYGQVEVHGRIAPVLSLGAGFDPELTGRENAVIGGVVLGLKRADIVKRFESIAAFAAIGQFIDQPMKLYSTGMFMRLAFAICAHVDAELLVIDESLSVGDTAFQDKCKDFIRNFRRTGSILLVSHSVAEVQNLCDRVIWIDRGRIREMGKPSDVIPKYQNAVHEEHDDASRFLIEA
jgi:lipopolysaccharide transport system ATP-binding protein